jgi:AraC family transcriptional activator of pobA
MDYMFEDIKTNAVFALHNTGIKLNGSGILKGLTVNTIVCNRQEDQAVIIDGLQYVFPTSSMLVLMANESFSSERPQDLTTWRFNREFCSMLSHEQKIGCIDCLFHGIKHPLFITLNPDEREKISIIEKLCRNDMKIRDRMQGEILRTLLNYLIVNVVRISRRQADIGQNTQGGKQEVLRKFNLLLEGHFRMEHKVQFYARALNRSPKTLANLFAMFCCPSPSKLIQSRIILEAKRYLYYTDKPAKEIAYILGFANPVHFSHFFKQHTGYNCSALRENPKDPVRP